MVGEEGVDDGGELGRFTMKTGAETFPTPAKYHVDQDRQRRSDPVKISRYALHLPSHTVIIVRVPPGYVTMWETLWEEGPVI